MKGFFCFFVYTFILILIYPFSGFAEGTKQLMPDSADSKKAYIMPANGNSGGNLRDPFALYNGDTNYRLKVHIQDFTKERIFFGLGAVVTGGGSVNWRMHKPDGTVVWSGTTPTSGTGFKGDSNRLRNLGFTLFPVPRCLEIRLFTKVPIN